MDTRIKQLYVLIRDNAVIQYDTNLTAFMVKCRSHLTLPNHDNTYRRRLATFVPLSVHHHDGYNYVLQKLR